MPIIKASDDYHFHPDPTDENDSQDDDIYDTLLDYQQWQEWYQTDLMNMWMGMMGYCDQSYLRSPLMGPMTYHNFCEFVYTFSSRTSSRFAS